MKTISNLTDVGGIRAVITADATGFNQTLDKARAKAKDLGDAGKEASSSFSALNSRLSDLGVSANHIDKINDRLRKANPQLLQRQLEAVRTELQTLGASSSEIDKITRELESNARVANLTTNEVKQLGLAYAALSVAMGAVIAKAIETAAIFEQSMAKVKAITGATGDEFEKLRDQAIDLGATTVFTSSQAADAQSYLAMAGFKTNQILAAMPGVLALAAAGQMDLARTSDIASNILTGFQLEAEESMRVVDVMAKTMSSANTNIEQLGYAMKYVAPVAASLGLSIEETAAAIGKLSDAGIQGEMAGTQLRAILLRLVSPAGEAAEVMDKLNINIKDANGGILPLAQIIAQLEGSFKNLSVAQQAEVASLIAGTEAASGFLTLIKTGSRTIESFTEELKNSGGAAEEIATTQMDTLKGSIEEMKSALEAVGIEVGDNFAPAVRKVVDIITQLLLGFTQLDPALQAAIIAFPVATAGVLGLVAAVGALTIAINALNVSFPLLGAIALAIGLVTAGISALVTSYGAAEERTRKFEEAQQSLNEELNKSPLQRTVSEVQQLQEKTDELNGILGEHAAIQQRLNELRAQGDDGFADGKMINEMYDLMERLGELEEMLQSLGHGSFEEATENAKRLTEEVSKSIPALVEMKHAELADAAAKQEKITQMEQLSTRYKELAAQQSLDESQKQELVNITNTLKKQYPDLHALMDEEGRIRITNTELIDDQINAERRHVDQIVEDSVKMVTVWETTAEAQRISIESQIKNLEALSEAMSAVAGSKSRFDVDLGFYQESMDAFITDDSKKRRDLLYDEQVQNQATIAELKRLRAGLEGGNLDEFKAKAGGAGVDLSKTKKEKTSKGKSAKDLARDLRKKAYDADMSAVRYQADMYDWSADKQIAAYEKVRAKHKQHLKETVEDERSMNLQIKRLNEDTVRSRFEFSSEWIRMEQRRMEDTGKSEEDIAKMKIDAWTRLRDRYSKDSEFYKQANEQIYQSQKQLVQAQFDFSSDWIKAEERRMEESGKSEQEITRMKLDAWTRLRDRYDKHTDYYKRADEQVYQLRKKLVQQEEKLATDLLKKQVSGINEAKKAELDAISDRKKAMQDYYDSQIRAIDDLIAKEREMNADEDYETLLAEKRARLALLQSAVGPEGIKEREDLEKEIERLQLEHERELRQRELESQKEALQEQKGQREEAFDNEKKDVESKYDALKAAFDEYSGDVKTIESAIANFRVQSNAETNAQILADLDSFVAQYNSKLSAIQAVSSYDSMLAEYNANKDSWDTSKARGDYAEMARLNARNEEIRKMYGISKDTGKLQAFRDGGVVAGIRGSTVPVIAHAGEMFLNDRQQAALFAMLDSPFKSAPSIGSSTQVQQIVNHIDMSVNDVTLEDDADIETLYSERERVATRLYATGVKTI